MLYRFKLLLANPSKSLWIHPTLGAVFAIIFSLLAKGGNYVIPAGAVPAIDADILNDLLNIIASSMLAVTTFSLSIMVSALASGSNSATPRARLLIMADGTARIAIASFISAFIYSVIAKIALSLQYYGEQGRFILFFSTVLVLFYIIFTLIRWVHTLSQLGSLGDALEKIENVAMKSLAAWRFQPNLGAVHAAPSEQNADLHVVAQRTGYLFSLNMAGLQATAEKYQAHVHINERPGKFLTPDSVILEVFLKDVLTEEQQKTLIKVLYEDIVIDINRGFDQDPRFGLLVMSEVGQRAMSASINDPATAISVLNALTRLIVDTPADKTLAEERFDRLSIIPFEDEDMIISIFAPIARDSVSNLEVNERLIKSLSIIAHHAPESSLQSAARIQAQHLIERCLHHFEFEFDRQALIRSFEQAFPKQPLA